MPARHWHPPRGFSQIRHTAAPATAAFATATAAVVTVSCATQIDESPLGTGTFENVSTVDSNGTGSNTVPSSEPVSTPAFAPASSPPSPTDAPPSNATAASSSTPVAPSTPVPPAGSNPEPVTTTPDPEEGEPSVGGASTSEPSPTPTSAAGSGGTGGAAESEPEPDGEITDPVEPDGSELLFDDFEDGNADGWLADASDGDDRVGDWQVVAGNGGFVYRQATVFGDATHTYAGDDGWTDVFLQADVAFLTTSDASDGVGEDGFVYFQVRRALRDGSEDDFNYVVLEFRSDGQFRIRQRLDGSSGDPIADWNDLGFQATAGQWHHIGVHVQGDAIAIYYNDIEILDGVIPAGLEAGHIGIGVVDATIDVDNVVVSLP